jgi:hypothetical protein
MNRRHFLRLGVAGAVCAVPRPARAAPAKLLLVHGRAQQGKDPVRLKAEWLDALAKGARKINRRLPAKLEVDIPFYGDSLDEFAKRLDVPLSADVRARGAVPDEDFLVFQNQVAEELRVAAGVTDAQVDAEYVPNEKPKGPLNWEWVHAIIAALDKYAGGLNGHAIEAFTRDVFLYTRRAGVRDEVDRIVASSLTESPTVIVGHSLGSVVAYSILRRDRRALNVPALITVGSPLGVRAIRDGYRPLRYPGAVKDWFNAFDKRDVVALYPLDANNFPVTPAIRNVDHINNGTDNRHGISGYLEDSTIAREILDALGG